MTVARNEGATIMQVPDPDRSIYVLRDVIQRDPGQPDLRKHYVLVADSRRDLVYLAYFETPVTDWDKNWPLAEKILDLRWFGVEGRVPGR